MAVKRKNEKHICSECIGEFDSKDIFTAQVPDRYYSTNYCAKCLKILGIKEFKPYLKPRKPRTKKVDTTAKTKKSTTAKTKKSTTAKTKKSTTAKTKK